MNERITELIIEANNYATEKHPIPDDADSMTKELIIGNRFGESQRKLAELIVRDCMEHALEIGRLNPYPQTEMTCRSVSDRISVKMLGIYPKTGPIKAEKI